MSNHHVLKKKMAVVVGFRFPKEARFFLFLIEFRLAIELNQPIIQWIPGALSLGLNRPG
jgi:hypothetical protein